MLRWPWNTKRVDAQHVAILNIQTLILETQGAIMTGLTDLQAALAAQATAIGNIDTYLKGLPAAILALQGASDPDGALETLAQQVQAQTETLTTDLSSAPPLASISPIPTPTPAP